MNLDRRIFLKQASVGAALFTVPGLFAELLADSTRLIETARLTEGPYYPDRPPLDTDNDLLLINDAATPALGEIAYLSGRVLTTSGEPLRNAFVEIWQCDAKASYIHSRGRNSETGHDANFQGYGRFLTAADGRYFFRTIKPVPYTLQDTFRTPHIHMAVNRNGKRLLTTQLLIRNHPDNERDGVIRNLRGDPKALGSLMADFVPLPGAKLGELTASFDLVIGVTVAEDEEGKLRGGLGRERRGFFGG